MKKLLLLVLIGTNFYSIANVLQFNPDDAKRFEETNKCENCNLTRYSINIDNQRKDRRYANVTGSDITKLVLVQLESCQFNWSYSNFSNVFSGEGTQIQGNFSNSSFENSRIYAGKFWGNFSNVNFKNATLVKSNFSGTNLSGAIFTNANVEYSDFSNSDSEEIDFRSTNIHHSNFKESYVDMANFGSVNLTGANFNFAKATGTNFIGANLTGTTFVNANLCNAHITETQLKQISDLSCAVKVDCSGRYPSKDGKPCSN